MECQGVNDPCPNIDVIEGCPDAAAIVVGEPMIKSDDLSRVYVCSPYTGDVETNTKNACDYCRFVIKQGKNPLASHLLYPQFLDDNLALERQRGLELGIDLLRMCDELWWFGSVISDGMKAEIEMAQKWGIPVRYYDSECRIIKDVQR